MADDVSTIYIRLDSSQYERAEKTVEAFNEKLSASVDRLIDAILKLGKSFDSVSGKLTKAATTSQDTADKVSKIKKSAEDAATGVLVLESELTKYQIEAGKATSATKAYQVAFARLGDTYGKSEASMARWLPQLNKVEAAIQKQSMAMDAAGQNGRRYYETTDRIATMQDVLTGKLRITSQGFEEVAAKADKAAKIKPPPLTEFEKAAQKAKQLPLAYQDAFSKLAKSGADMKTWLPTLNKVEAGIQKQAHAMNMAGQAGQEYYQHADRIALMQDVMAGRLKITANGFEEVAASVEKQKRGLQHLLPHVFAVTAAYMSMRTALRGFVEMARTGIDFEHQMAIVGSITRATAMEFEALEQAAIQAGESTVWTASEAADALKYLGMAGFQAAEAIKALPGVLDLALIGSMDLGRATDITSDTLVALGMQVEEIDRVVDVFTGTITRTNTNIEMMGQAMKFTAPLAGQLGYTVEETSAMIGILAQSGIKAGIAGRGLQMAFNKTASAAQRLGLDAGANLIDVLKELERQQISVSEITTMFGMNALKSVLVLKENVAQYENLVDVLKNSEGEAAEFVNTLDTVQVSFRLLKSVIQSIAIDAFDRYRDSLKGVVDDLTKFFREHKGAIIDTIEVIGALIKHGVDLAAHFVLFKGAVKAWKTVAADAAIATDILSTKQTRLATAVKAANAAFMRFLPYLAIYAGFKLVEKIYAEHKALEDLVEAGGAFERKWNDLRDLEPIDLSAKLKGGEGFKRPIEEAENLIAQYEDRIKSSLAWGMVFTLDPHGYYEKNIKPMLEKIEEAKGAIADLQYAEFLSRAGITRTSKGESDRLGLSHLLDGWKSISDMSAAEQALKGEITGETVKEMQRFLPSLKEQARYSDEARRKYEELTEAIKRFQYALRAVDEGLISPEGIEQDALEARQRAAAIRGDIVKAMGGTGGDIARKYYDDIDAVRRIIDELEAQTQDIVDGKSLHEYDAKLFEHIRDARIKAYRDAQQEEQKALEDINRSYEKMLTDRMLKEEDYEAYVSAKWDHLLAKYAADSEEYRKVEELKLDDLRALQEKATSSINKDYEKMVMERARVEGTYEQHVTEYWDGLLEKYKDNAELYKKIEELKEHALGEIRRKGDEDEARAAKEKAEVYREITEDIKGLEGANYKFRMKLLDEQFKHYLKVLEGEKEALEILLKWRQQMEKELWRESVEESGSFSETFLAAADGWAEQNMNLSTKMYDTWYHTFELIDETMADTFASGFKDIGDSWDGLLDEMKAEWRRLAYYIIRNQIIAKITGGVSIESLISNVAGNAVGAKAGSVLAGAGGTAIGSSAGSLLSGAGLAAIGTGIAGFAEGTAAGVYGFTGGLSLAETMGVGTTGAEMAGLAAGWVAVPVAIGALGYSLYKSHKDRKKYQHAGNWSASLDFDPLSGNVTRSGTSLSGKRYEGIVSEALTEATKETMGQFPEWLRKIYKPELDEFFADIESQTFTVFSKRYRDQAGDWAAFEKDLMEEINFTGQLESFLDYWQDIAEEAGNIFSNAVSSAMQAVDTDRLTAFTADIKQQLFSSITTAMLEAFTQSSLIQGALGPFLDEINTQIAKLTEWGDFNVNQFLKGTYYGSIRNIGGTGHAKSMMATSYLGLINPDDYKGMTSYIPGLGPDNPSTYFSTGALRADVESILKSWANSTTSALNNALATSDLNVDVSGFKNDLLSWVTSSTEAIASSIRSGDLNGVSLANQMDAVIASALSARSLGADFNPLTFGTKIQPAIDQVLRDIDEMGPAFESLSTVWEKLAESMGVSLDGVTGAAEDLTKDLVDGWIMPVVESWKAFMDEMLLSDLAPVQSYESYQSQYESLMEAAQTGGRDAMEDLFGYVRGEYLPFMQEYTAAGADYHELWDSLFGAGGQLSTFSPTISTDATGVSEEITEAIRESFGELIESMQSVNGQLQIVLKLDNTTMGTYIADLIRNNGEVIDALGG